MSRVRPALYAVPLVVALATTALTGCSGKNSVDQSAGGSERFVSQAAGLSFTAPAKRKTAPNLSGDTLTGGKLDLAADRGRVVVLNFWASWCAPCRAETTGLVQVAKARPDVSFVGVNEKETSPSAARAFVRDQNVPYPSIIDKIGTLAAQWPAGVGIPTTFVLDKQGRIAARFSGGVLATDLTTAVDRVSAGS